MHPLIWLAAGAASSLGWKWSRSGEDEEQAPPEVAEVEVEEAPEAGPLRRVALYVAMLLVTAGRWVRSTGSAMFPRKGTNGSHKSALERTPETAPLSQEAEVSESAAKPEKKLQEPR